MFSCFLVFRCFCCFNSLHYLDQVFFKNTPEKYVSYPEIQYRKTSIVEKLTFIISVVDIDY